MNSPTLRTALEVTQWGLAMRAASTRVDRGYNGAVIAYTPDGHVTHTVWRGDTVHATMRMACEEAEVQLSAIKRALIRERSR